MTEGNKMDLDQPANKDDQVDTYVMMYMKINSDKTRKLTLNGMYFGAIGTKEYVDTIARQCVNCQRNGVIIPKSVRMVKGGFIDTIYDIIGKFEKMLDNMKETEEIMQRQQK